LPSCWGVSVLYGTHLPIASTDGRFSSVSDRFIEFLEKYKDGVIPKEKEGTVENVIRGMTYLKIKVQSRPEWI
jgi:Cell morphogenesis N-terminal